MEYFIIAISSFLASLLTFFSGFGLATILTPVFLLLFPLDSAIALTAIVHFLNNIFKLIITYKHIINSIVLKFGVPSLVASVFGAFMFVYAKNLPELYSYCINGKQFHIMPVNVIIALLIFSFSALEIRKMSLNGNYFLFGGFVSGFFGGLSGHQGALRTTFLLKSLPDKEKFIATGIAIACMVDVARLPVYFTTIDKVKLSENIILLLCAVLSAFVGAYTGNKFLTKTTFGFLQKIVTICLVLFSLALAAGLI